MKLSYNWLSEYVDLKDIDFDTLVHKTNLHISETEAAYSLINKTSLEIGYVKSCQKLEDSNHLHLCVVSLSDKDYNIVCGASNIKEGLYVIVAKPGANFNNIEIKECKIKGQKSEGMICSLEELGFLKQVIPDEFKNGIFYFKEKPKTNDPYKELFLDDKVVELDLTPNRSDLLSVYGCAHDFAAIFNRKLNLKDIDLNLNVRDDFKINLLTDKCKTFTFTRLNVVVKESPLFIQERLMASGIKPENNIVDISNYVMLEYGTPSHAYDLSKLDSSITCRSDYSGSFRALDNNEYLLEEGDLVICSNKPVAIAGVIGGFDSMISESTKEILLEFAVFDPLSVRKTAKRLGLNSEASKRFERKVPVSLIPKATKYAISLLIKYADATVIDHNHILDFKKEEEVTFTIDRLNSFSGLNLDLNTVSKILDAYNFKYTILNDTFSVSIPDRRKDLEANFQDICEEILRYIGFYTLPETLPNINLVSKSSVKEDLIDKSRQFFRFSGFNEVINYSLVQERKASRFNKELVKVLLPLTEERSVLRPSITMSLLDNVMYNRSYGNNDLFLFEVSNVYADNKESTYIAGVATGTYLKNNINSKDYRVSDYFYLKGILENYFASLNINVEFRSKTISHPLLNNFNSSDIYIDDLYVGYIGEICPVVAKVYNLDMCIFFELDIDILASNLKEDTYNQISKFPSIKRDLAFVLSNEIDSYLVLKYLDSNKNLFLSLASSKISDVFKIDDKFNSITFSFKFKSDHTLESSEVDEAINKIIESVTKEFKAKLR